MVAGDAESFLRTVVTEKYPIVSENSVSTTKLVPSLIHLLQAKKSFKIVELA